MGKYFTERDLALFNKINTELISGIIDTKVNIYKLNRINISTNIYNENLSKIYYENIPLGGLIEHEEPFMDYDTSQVMQNIKVKFLRSTLSTLDLVLQEGDVIEYDEKYYKIVYVVENQFVGGRVENKHSIICICTLTRESLDTINEIKSYANAKATDIAKVNELDDNQYNESTYEDSIYQ